MALYCTVKDSPSFEHWKSASGKDVCTHRSGRLPIRSVQPIDCLGQSALIGETCQLEVLYVDGRIRSVDSRVSLENSLVGGGGKLGRDSGAAGSGPVRSVWLNVHEQDVHKEMMNSNGKFRIIGICKAFKRELR